MRNDSKDTIQYPSILVVDDEDSTREFIAELTQELVPLETIIQAKDGQEAAHILHSAEGRAVRLVISDLKMPYLNGVSLIKEISLMRERGETQAQAIIVTGVRITPIEESRLTKAGVLAVISKPFRAQDFNRIILDALALPFDEYQATIAHAEHLEALMMLGEMSSTIVHEIRNPLTVLLSLVSLIKNEFISGNANIAKISHFVDRINENTLRIAKTVDSVAALSRKPSEVEDEIEVFTIKSIEAQGLYLLRLLMKDLNVSFSTDIDSNLFMKGSAIQIVQVLINLVKNAAEAVAELAETERWVKLTIQRDQQQIVFLFENGGPLIPLILHNKIFTRFFTTKPKGKGTGLGLPLCRIIAERHSGTLELLTSTSHTSFEMRIPLLDKDDIAYPLVS